MLPVTANIAAMIGGYTYNAQKIRMVGILINSPLWIVYDIVVGSWAGILAEIVSEVSMLISMIRYGWKNMDSPVSSARGILLVRSLKKIGRRKSIIGSYGGEFYVLLVVYVNM